jgi:hypothetical protein
MTNTYLIERLRRFVAAEDDSDWQRCPAESGRAGERFRRNLADGTRPAATAANRRSPPGRRNGFGKSSSGPRRPAPSG